LKSKKINHSLFLHFWNVGAIFRSWSSGKKKPYLQYVLSNFLTLAIELHLVHIRFGASYIWTTLLITVHTFAVVIISLHIRKCVILLHLAWLNGKMFGFTLFSIYSHQGRTAALVCDSVYPLLNSGWVCFLVFTQSAVNQRCQPVFTRKARPCHKKCQIAVLRHIHIKHA